MRKIRVLMNRRCLRRLSVLPHLNLGTYLTLDLSELVL